MILDTDSESPREWDNLGRMICFHKRYSLGDEHNASIEELKEIVARPGVFSLPIFMYEHSGIGISTDNSRYPFNCPWDAGQIGYIYVTREKVRGEYSVKRISKKLARKVMEVLQSEVDIYNQYLSGDVYGFSITRDGEVVDGCWGFYGFDYCLEEAKKSIDFMTKEQEGLIY